jgi:hypothetical protein
MINSQASNVVALLKKYDQFRKNLKLNEQLKSRGDELRTAGDGLEELAMQVALLRQRDWLKDSQLPSADVEKVQGMIDKIRELLADDPGKIDALVHRVVKGCESIAAKAEKRIADAWEDVVRRCQPAVDEAELKRCEQFDSEAAVVDQIRRLSRVSVARVPSDRAELTEIEMRWDQVRKLIGSLPKGSDNPDVNRFLAAVRKGGAPLELLTDSVRQYLEETGKAKAFRIYQVR